MPRRLTCREFIEFLMDYLDGELDGGQRETFEGHLATCPRCVEYVESYKATIEAGKAAYSASDEEELLSDVPEALVRAIVDSRKQD